LTGNQLTNLSGLSGLEPIVVYEFELLNQMKTLPALSGLPSLNNLVLSDNELTAVPALGGLPNLQIALSLHQPRSRTCPIWHGIPSLRWLYLAGNSLQVIDPLRNAPALYYVDLTDNLLDTSPGSPASCGPPVLARATVLMPSTICRNNRRPRRPSPCRSGWAAANSSSPSTARPVRCSRCKSPPTSFPGRLLRSVTNTTGVLTFTDSSAAGTHQFYRLYMQ
jgi:Leucine-rich repeat (LRR) protein